MGLSVQSSNVAMGQYARGSPGDRGIRRNTREAVGGRGGRQDARSLTATGYRATVLQAHPDIVGPPARAGLLEPRGHPEGLRHGRVASLQTPQQRRPEEQECDEQRDRVAGQDQQRRVLDSTECQWLARFDRDSEEREFADRLGRGAHVVAVADGGAAAGDDEIGVRRGPCKSLSRGVGVVGDGVDRLDFRAELCSECGQHVAIGFVDLAVSECFARRYQFIPGNQQGDAHARMDMDACGTRGRRQRDVLRPHVRPGGEDRLIAREILGGRSDVRSVLGHFLHEDPVAIDPAVLLHDDGIGAVRDRGAGKYPRRRTRLERRRRAARRDPLTDREPVSADIGQAQRIAIHRAVGPARHRQARDHVGGEDTS